MSGYILSIKEVQKLTEGLKGFIGVFWVLGACEVDGYREPIASGTKYGDTIQPSIDHYEYWEEFLKYYPVFKKFEYDQIPRGRVVYYPKEDKFRIITSKAVAKDRRTINAIRRFYRLTGKVEIVTDEHYEDPAFWKA